MATRLNIAAISRRTGVAPDTLRKWEARYGVLRPERSPGGQRRYSEQDIARVDWLRARLAEGWRIGEAARMLVETGTAPESDPAALRDALLDAATSDEPARVGALLDQAFAVLPLEVSLGEVVTPVLRRIGEEWHAGRISVAVEHAVSAKVRAKLEQLMADHRSGTRGTAVLACAPGEQHDLGLLMLAVALRRDGWSVEYLGADTPVGHAIEFAARIEARVVCFSASRDDTFASLEDALAALDDRHGVELVVGGPAAQRARIRALGARPAAEELGEAVAQLRAIAA